MFSHSINEAAAMERTQEEALGAAQADYFVFPFTISLSMRRAVWL